tara:strand:+ start:1583 stop:2026 length:444 start_codon:yes stop_codon:yes gene_type:complete
MALKPDRVEHLTDLSFFMDEIGTRGQIVTHSSDGSGASMDDANAKVIKATATGQNPAGLLLNDVVDIDLTRQHINFAKDEVQKGGKVLLLRRGTVVTDNVAGTPAAGAKAYFTSDAKITSAAGSVQIGRFLSAEDADGYAKVEINIV